MPEPQQVIGIDLSKRVFQIHVSTLDGQVIRQAKLQRADLHELLTTAPPSLVAMEACSGAHYWAAEAKGLGHVSKLLHAKTVSRLRQAQKNDANDAATICLAARLQDVLSVPWKSPEQRGVLAMHAMRQLVVRMRYSASNQLLGLLHEFGDEEFTASGLTKATNEELKHRWRAMPENAVAAFLSGVDRLRWLKREEGAIEKQLSAWHRNSESSTLLETIPGIGLFTATAFVATVGTDPSIFATARSVSSWLGLVPMQHSTGGIARLGRVGKRGDRYLRGLLFNAATSLILRVYRDNGGPSFIVRLLNRDKHQKVIACAVANKLARTGWALLRDACAFDERPEWQREDFSRAK